MSVGASSQARVVLLFCVCGGVAAAIGYLSGAGYAIQSAWTEGLDSPLARLGYRIEMPDPELPEEFPSVEDDLAAAEKQLGEPTGTMLRLLVALRGVDEGSGPWFTTAGQLCAKLSWPRCDDAALRRMKELVEK
jgi:hypothetical protein